MSSNLRVPFDLVLFSYTKIGYAGNSEPQMIMPSAIAVKDHVGKIQGKISDLDFYIGDEALAPTAANYSVKVFDLAFSNQSSIL